MINHRLRIFSSLLIAFVIVRIYANFTDIKKVFADFKIPEFNVGKLFTLNFGTSDVRNGFKPFPTDQSPTAGFQFGRISPTPLLPTQSGFAGQAPTSPAVVLTKAGPTKTPTKKPTLPAVVLTKAGPTKPAPTKTPKPSPTPKPAPITSDLRPGTTMREIFAEVSKRMCFPTALLMAFKDEESGAFFSSNSSSSTIKIYNTYGWWINGTGDPCFGLGYHTQTGIVPQDSVAAGTQCRNAVGDPNDIGIMGIFQISQEEETLSRKNTIATLPKSIDRRVLFDNALIFASITKNRIGTVPKDCNNWPDDVILTAAEKHQGVCVANYGNGNTRNYCQDVLRLYKQYR